MFLRQYFCQGARSIWQHLGIVYNYSYDTFGNIVSEKRNDALFKHLEYDNKGNITAIYSNGALLCSYVYDGLSRLTRENNFALGYTYIFNYDAAGNCTIKTDINGIAGINPFRYRGYYFDSETGFYYVSSRYYDPVVGRWVNADSAIAGVGGDVQGYNLFAYCMNNPVNMSDHTGNWLSWATKLIIGTVCAVGKTVAISTAVRAGVGAVSHRLETGTSS